MDILDFLRELTHPESIIKYGGLALLLFVVFAETGLLIGFFLPGDSLLFTAGLLCGTGVFKTDIITLCGGLCGAGILGNLVGYFFGRKVGPALFKRDDSLIFKKKYVAITREFYERNGGKTLILGRFLPIIRTFAPILAGVIQINFKKFMFYNIIGCVLWVGALTVTGYFLGVQFPWVKHYLEYIILALIVVTLIPVYRTYHREKQNNQNPE